MRGKQKCRMLREIRRRIADENDIPFVTEECKYKGDCKGTCPKCESELKYLEEELDRRRSLGLRVSVSALAVGMVAASATGCTPVTAGYIQPPEGDVSYVTESEPDTEVLDGEVAATENGRYGPLSDEGMKASAKSGGELDGDIDPDGDKPDGDVVVLEGEEAYTPDDGETPSDHE